MAEIGWLGWAFVFALIAGIEAWHWIDSEGKAR